MKRVAWPNPHKYVDNIPGFRIRIRIHTDPHVFALPGSGSGQKGKEMNEYIIIL